MGSSVFAGKIAAPEQAKKESAQGLLVSKATADYIFGNEIRDNELTDLNFCLIEFKINTKQRMRHFLSQIAHESGGLKFMQEIGDDDYFTRMYEGREDLGNNQKGDGIKFAGVGPIQTTGRGGNRDEK